tara:strand:+ start:101 stop:322 length:222 start_codon:yes stop_codon:yes gene_type:complete
MSKEENDLSFEQGIKKLEEILSKLENQETPLEEMIDLYEKANKLTNVCRKKLESADKKMSKLIKGSDNKFSEE